MSIKGSAIKQDVCREILKDHSNRTELAIFLKKNQKTSPTASKENQSFKTFSESN